MSACTVSGTARPSTSPRSREHAHELLGVERVAAGALEQSTPASRPAGASARGGRCRSRAVLLVGERRERDRRRVALAAAPARPPLEELGPRGAEERGAARPQLQSSEVLEEVEQRVVRPVEILEHEDARPPRGQRLEEPAPGGERLLAADAPPLRLARRRAARAVRRTTRARTRRRRDRRRIASSFAARLAGSSDSRMPASAFTISPSAQNVIPSPYGRQRPWRQRDEIRPVVERRRGAR